MTSRVSFHKLIIETLRRHTAAVLITVLGFFIHIVTFFMSVQNTLNARIIEDYTLQEAVSGANLRQIRLTEDLFELCSPKFAYGVFALGFGVYLAFDFLRYLHSKRETDFYDSLPIRRQTWFKTIFTSCFLLFFVLSAVTAAIETGIVFSTGYGSLAILQAILWNYICMLGAFLVAWFTTALAMIMTGHSIIAFLGFGVFASYVPLILANLAPTYCARFFDTYVDREPNPNIYYFSPVTVVYKMTNSWFEWDIKEHWNYIIGCFVLAIIIGTIAYILFLRRPSETAGRAMAFEKANDVIRFMIVIPLTLFAGLFLEEMATMTSMAWLVFGIVFGGFLLHGIMECIFQFDIKALLTKKKQLLATFIICIAFVFVFWIDLFKYDDYIPDAEDVKIVKIDSNLFGRINTEWDDERDWIQGDLVKDAIAVVKEIKDCEIPSDDEIYYKENNFYNIKITYVMKNGREVLRDYSFDASKTSENLSKLYANEDVKDDYCVLYNIGKENIQGISVNNGITGMDLELSKEELNEFIDIYLDEYSKLELEQTLSEMKVYEMNVSFQFKNMQYPTAEHYYIYASFEKSIAYLKEKGMKNFQESEDISITNMEIFGNKYDEKYGDSNRYVSDSEQLQELKQYIILDDFSNYAISEDYLYCEIQITSEAGISYSGCFIKKSDLDKIIGN